MTIKVSVRLLPKKKAVTILELRKGSTVEDVIRALELYPDAWIAVRGGSPLPIDERLNDGDDIKLISVFSGG